MTLEYGMFKSEFQKLEFVTPAVFRFFFRIFLTYIYVEYKCFFLYYNKPTRFQFLYMSSELKNLVLDILNPVC